MLRSFLKRKPRALLLEDDPAMQRLVTLLLRREGLNVDAVGKGLLAVEKIEREKYDAILLDLMMPHEGGMTVIKVLREKTPELLRRVILLTATPAPVTKSIEKEVFAIVRKPFEAEALIAAVRQLIRG